MQAQTLAELQVDRDIGRRATGEERRQAAFAQAGQHQRVGVATGLEIDNRRVGHQGDKQHAAHQYQQQVQVIDQSRHA